MYSTAIFMLALMLIGSCAHVRGGDAFPFLPPGSEYEEFTDFPSDFMFYEVVYTKVQMYNFGTFAFESYSYVDVLSCSSLEEREMQTRLSNATDDLQKVAKLARQYKQFGSCYTPQWVYVATWDNEAKTFQAVLATDGQRSFLLLEYDSVSADGVNNGPKLQGNKNVKLVLMKSYSIASVTDLPKKTNIGVPGRFLFRVDEADAGLPTIIKEEDKCKGMCEDGQCQPCKPDEYFSECQDRCISRADKCKGVCTGGQCLHCKPHEYLLQNQSECISMCSPCSSVGEYTKYPGTKWEGNEIFILIQFSRTDATSAREDCQAECTRRIFCAAFALKETADETKCIVLNSALSASEFTYDQTGATFFHKKCK